MEFVLFTSLSDISKDFIKAKAQKPSIENQKLIAEITAKYAEAEEKVMSARRSRAEAESIELDNAMKKLRYAFEAIAILKKIRLYNAYSGESCHLFWFKPATL